MPKQDLAFPKPMMNAAGTLGFAPDVRALAELGLLEQLGAFVTNPLSLRPRSGAARPSALSFPGGFLLHTGLPNPGLARASRNFARGWAESPLPIILHLLADRPEETAAMIETAESLENVAAAELGFAPLLADDIILLAVEKSLGELPLIICLGEDQLLRLGPRVLEQGAAAVSIAAPRGLLPAVGAEPGGLADEWVTGRVFGPALFPRSLALVEASAKLRLPVIGGGGVYSSEQARLMLAAGAMAVQIDAALWRGLQA